MIELLRREAPLGSGRIVGGALIAAGLLASSASLAYAEGLPLRYERSVSFETGEGTWLSLDISPDDQTIVFELLGDIYTLPADGGRATPLLSGLPFDAQPVFSPDGRHLAFVSDRSGNENVWISDADGSNLRQVSKAQDGERFSSPAWSADGNYIYVSRREELFFTDCELWLYHVGGGRGVQLRSADGETRGSDTGKRQALGAYASADGRYVYFARSDMGSCPDRDQPFPWYIVRRVVRTGEEQTVLHAPGGAFRPVLSPNGRYLAYATRLGSRTALRVRDLATGQDRQLVYPIERDMQEALATRDLIAGYDFAPDGEALIIAYGGQIRRVALRSGASEVIPFTARVELEIGPDLRTSYEEPTGPVRARIIQAPSWSPDGTRIAFSAFGKLHVADAAGGAPTRLTDTPLVREGMSEHQPAWSPDGRWLAYVSWRSGGGHIFKARADGRGKPQRLTRAPAFYRKPAFTPDGDEIIALRSSAHDRQQRYRDLGERPYMQDVIAIPAGGGGSRVLAHLPERKARTSSFVVDWGKPHFTGDPDAVYVYTMTGLVRVPLRQGPPLTIIKVMVPNASWGLPDVPVQEVRLGPDGAWALALQESQLYLFPMPPVGTENFTVDLTDLPVPRRKLTEIGADYFSWSADGRTIHWAVGSTLYSLPLSSVDFTARKPVKNRLAEAAASRLDIAVELPRDVPEGSLVLRGAMAVTMRGDEIIERADIVIRGNRIAAVGAPGEVEVPGGATVVDVSGKFITPGFVDAHAHWVAIRRDLIEFSAWPFAANLAYGVTAGLDVQAFTPDVFVYRDLIDAGVIAGPRAYSVGRGVFADNRFTSKKHALAVLTRYRAHYRTHNIKAYLSGNRRQRQYVVQAADELEMLPTTEGGFDTKLDLTHAMDGFAGNEHSLPTIPLYQDVVQLYAQTGIGYTPALLVNYGGPFAEEYFYSRYNPLENKKLRRFMPLQFLDERARRREIWVHDQEFVFAQIAASAAEILRRGGRVGVGSHGQLEGLGYHWGLQALAAGGLTPHEVLKMATRGSADIIGRGGQFGVLAPRAYADLIVFNRNPLEDIRDTQSLEYIMKNGRLYDADDLQEIR